MRASVGRQVSDDGPAMVFHAMMGKQVYNDSIAIVVGAGMEVISISKDVGGTLGENIV